MSTCRTGVHESGLENSLHLYQCPLYRAGSGPWRSSFPDAVDDAPELVSWDPAAILSIMAFNYACGDRTLLKEVRRLPWLSRIGADGDPEIETIPRHGLAWRSPAEIARGLYRRLRVEAARVCKGRENLYILLSGGLDSRIVAGVLAKLQGDGELEASPICVTWGLEGSRDVVYGRRVAEILGFEWVHVDIGPGDLLENTLELGVFNGALVSPVHLHCMGWFKRVPRCSLVLAGSYGDSVGRAEYSGRHVAQLTYLRPSNPFALIRKEALQEAYHGIMEDFSALMDRNPGVPRYVHCEHQMQGHYMRNMIAHAMSSIEKYCDIYQMFCDPEVYAYMWSIHPAARRSRTYAELLELLDPRLARLPWARTNRAPRGRTIGAQEGLRREFHSWVEWISGPLFEELRDLVDPEWLESTGIFNAKKVQALCSIVRERVRSSAAYGSLAHERWLWLACFTRMARWLERRGRTVVPHRPSGSPFDGRSIPVSDTKGSLAFRLLARADMVYRVAVRARVAVLEAGKYAAMCRSVWDFPPTPEQREDP